MYENILWKHWDKNASNIDVSCFHWGLCNLDDAYGPCRKKTNFFFSEPSQYLAKAICLRGTWYTLMSMHPEALKDFERVINLESAPAKV